MQNRRRSDLSGGKQQQLAIARTLISRLRLLLNEPTEGIQPNLIQQIGEVIWHTRTTSGTEIVVVEQYFDFNYDLAKKIVVL